MNSPGPEIPATGTAVPAEPAIAALAAAPARKKTLWAWAAATFFGTGLLRPGPGTWGSAAACLLWFAAGVKSRGARGELNWITLAAIVSALAVGVAASTRVERESGRKDPGHVVIDEAAGQWTALLFSPPDLRLMVAAFLLFRAFDILKPWPARSLEKLPGGWGIMFDDVAAGLYALVAVQLLNSWIVG